jgi:hypothetical protein
MVEPWMTKIEKSFGNYIVASMTAIQEIPFMITLDIHDVWQRRHTINTFIAPWAIINGVAQADVALDWPRVSQGHFKRWQVAVHIAEYHVAHLTNFL